MIDKYSPMFFGRAFSASFLKTVSQVNLLKSKPGYRHVFALAPHQSRHFDLLDRK